MHYETLDIEACREHLERLKPILRVNPSASEVQQHAMRFARRLNPDGVFSTRIQKEFLPIVTLVTRAGPRQSDERTEKFNAGVEPLIKEFEDFLPAVAAFQDSIRKNALMSPAERRNRVLRHLVSNYYERGDQWWSNEVAWELGFSQSQMNDAIDHWRRRGAITTKHEHVSSTASGRPLRFWLCELTSRAPDLVEQLESANASDANTHSAASPLPNIVIHNSYHGPTAIGTVGESHGPVTQKVTIEAPPALPIELRALLDQLPLGKEQLETLDEELAAAQPRPQAIRRVASSIKTLIEGANVAIEGARITPVAAAAAQPAFHQWMTQLTHWLSALPH